MREGKKGQGKKRSPESSLFLLFLSAAGVENGKNGVKERSFVVATTFVSDWARGRSCIVLFRGGEVDADCQVFLDTEVVSGSIVDS